jgi:hypothetical protein
MPEGAMPGQAEVSRTALDRADDLVGDMLANVEAFLGHGVPLFPFVYGPHDCGLVGQKGPGPLRLWNKRHALRRTARRAALHKQSAEMNRVDPEAGQLGPHKEAACGPWWGEAS